PNDFWLNANLAAGLGYHGSPRAAERVGYLRAALVLRPDSPAVHLNLGLALTDQGDLPGARAAFQKAIDLKPDYALAHHNKGNILHDQGDFPGAIAAYEKAIAALQKALAAYQEALAADQKAIDPTPDLALAHTNLGKVLHDQGDFPGAIAACQKAIALKPDYAWAHWNLGRSLLKQGELARALEELRRGHELGRRRFPSEPWLRCCERWLVMDGRFPDFLAGKATPANAGERIEL